jgi:hypothetical protein
MLDLLGITKIFSQLEGNPSGQQAKPSQVLGSSAFAIERRRSGARYRLRCHKIRRAELAERETSLTAKVRRALESPAASSSTRMDRGSGVRLRKHLQKKG